MPASALREISNPFPWTAGANVLGFSFFLDQCSQRGIERTLRVCAGCREVKLNIDGPSLF